MMRDKPPAALYRTEAKRTFHIKEQPLDTSKEKNSVICSVTKIKNFKTFLKYLI